MNRTTPPKAPAFEELPPRRAPSTETFTVSLAIVTPIFGGGYRTRELDDIDVIRVPTVRGHLRFWWRALFAGGFERSAALYDAETELWGGPGGSGETRAVRSPVEVRVEVIDRGKKDEEKIDPRSTAGAYVLFPAREPPALRRTLVTFKLTVSVSAPPDDIEVVCDAVRQAVQAWILFGGYGGRTRRGLGSLTVLKPDEEKWLPRAGHSLPDELRKLFKRDVFAVGGRARQTPKLAGAALCTIGGVTKPGVTAWRTAVDALYAFRQGTPKAATAPVTGAPSVPSAWARQPGSDPSRPSISNWPEADKIRHLAHRELKTGPYSHPPRHNETPVWPRAGFGLPIVGQFQKKDRRGGIYTEPPPFTLKWREPNDERRDRLASPLIIKALPLVGGQFVAIALWLHRDWPTGEIVLEIKKGNRALVCGAAQFDVLVAPGEAPFFTALAGKSTLRSAFFDWLALNRDGTTVFAGSDVGGGAR